MSSATKRNASEQDAPKASAPALGSSGLVKRFSKEQAELAAKISNDISEDIDCGESSVTLRMAVAYFADVACVEAQRARDAESKLEIFRCAKSLMDVALPAERPKLTERRTP